MNENYTVSLVYMEAAVENIIHYSFKNKKLLEEALAHSSFTRATSYERLGDPIMDLAISNNLYLANPSLNPGQSSLLRAANVSTKKLARIVVRCGIYRHVRHNSVPLINKVREFALSVADEDCIVYYGGIVKAPKVLADIVKSVAAAVYVDFGFDLKSSCVVRFCFSKQSMLLSEQSRDISFDEEGLHLS